MIRFLGLVAGFFAIIFAFAWLKDAPGEVALTVDGTTYAVGLARAALAFGVAVILAVIVLWLLRLVMRAPRKTIDAWAGRRTEKGRTALSQGLLAIAAGDVRTAERAASEAAKRSPDRALTHLLQAQTAQAKGDHQAARRAFTAMLESPATRIVGLRGLHIEAERDGDHVAARHYAQEGHKIFAGAPWASRALLRYQTGDGDWAGALGTLAAAVDKKITDKKTARRHRAVILAARAMDAEDSDPETAKQAALDAHNIEPGLVPAAVVAGRVLTRLGEMRRAAKVLEAAWKANPHPEIADAYAHVRPGDSARDRLKRMETLVKLSPQADEGGIALARAAMEARDWTRARATLMPIVRRQPTQGALLLMAEIEEGEHGDRGLAREWLARAVHAPRDPAWVADGMVLQGWAPVSPVSGLIDAVEWKVPAERLGGPPANDVEDGEPEPVENLPDQPGEPLKAVKETPPAEPAGDSEMAAAQQGPADGGNAIPLDAPAKPETGPAKAHMPQSGNGAGDGEASAAGEQRAAEPVKSDDKLSEKDASKAEALPDLPRPPDDPGIDEAEEEAPNRRFKLF